MDTNQQNKQQSQSFFGKLRPKNTCRERSKRRVDFGKNTKSIFSIILDFDNKTLFPQALLCFGLIAIFCKNFGFNKELISWLLNVVSYIFGTPDSENFALKYFITTALSGFILIKSLFAFIAILKYNLSK